MASTYAINQSENAWPPTRHDFASVGDEESKPSYDDQRGGDSVHMPRNHDTNVSRGMGQELVMPLRLHTPTQSIPSQLTTHTPAREMNTPLRLGPYSTLVSTYPSNDGPPPGAASESSGPTGSVVEWDSVTENTGDSHAWSNESTLCWAFPDRAMTFTSSTASPELAPRPCAYQRFSTLDTFSLRNSLTSESSDRLSSDGVAALCELDEYDMVDPINQCSWQTQQQEFENHPGHAFWEWVDNEKRWRRRGTEDEWFPEFIA